MKTDEMAIVRFIKTHVVLLGIFGIGAILRFWPVGLNSGFRFHMGWNEAHYVSEAENFRKYGWLNQKPVEAIGTGWFYTSNDYTHPPLITWIMAISILIVQNPELGGRIPIAVFGSLTLIVFYYITERLYPDTRRVGQIATFLFAFNPGHIYFSRVAQLDVPMLFFQLLSLYFLMIWLDGFKTQNISSKYGLLTGISLGLAVLSKFQALLFLVVLLFFVIYSKTIKVFLKTKGFFIFLVIIIIFASFWPLVALVKGDWAVMTRQLGLYAIGGNVDPTKFEIHSLTWYISTIIFWWGIEIFSLPILALSFLGLLLLLLRRKPNDLMVITWSIYYSILLFFWNKHDYYLLNSIPSSLIMVSVFFSIHLPQFLAKISIYPINPKRTTLLSYLFLLVIGIFSAYQTHGILAYYKCYSDFPDYRTAGLFIKEHSPKNALVIAYSIPVLKYYSNRTTEWTTDEQLLNSYLTSGRVVFVFIHEDELLEVHKTWNLVETYEIYKLYVNNEGLDVQTH